MPYRRSRETIAKEKRELRNRFFSKIFGVSFILIGILLELFHSLNNSKTLLWGTLFNISIYTSSILIIFGIIIVLTSFKRITDLLKKLKIFQAKK